MFLFIYFHKNEFFFILTLASIFHSPFEREREKKIVSEVSTKEDAETKFGKNEKKKLSDKRDEAYINQCAYFVVKKTSLLVLYAQNKSKSNRIMGINHKYMTTQICQFD